jgi:flagellar L-ring protein precursor FlgH
MLKSSSLPLTLGLTLSLALLCALPFSAQAESLFKPSAYPALPPMVGTPRMLYSPPRPSQIGDLVTVLVREKSKRQNKTQFQVQKQQTASSNTPQIINGVVKAALTTAKLAGVAPYLTLPTVGDTTNDNNNRSQSNITQDFELQDAITCQVVQVLPNGNLVVQGRKSSAMAKERTEVFVTGVVNPYFLDVSNQIESSKVANLQVMVAGQGPATRSQNDGLLTKMFQWLH